MAFHLSSCCSPILGDQIVGIITSGQGVSVHTLDCNNLEAFANIPERWLDVSWENDKKNMMFGQKTYIFL